MHEELQLLQLVVEPSRFQIIQILLSGDKELCVNEIADRIGSTPSAVSHHFAKLELAGIVDNYKVGRKVCYRVKNGEFTTKLRSIFNILLA